MKNKKKYKIGLGGLETSKLNFLKKKFKNIEFYSLNKNNFFKKFDLDSIVIFTEESRDKLILFLVVSSHHLYIIAILTSIPFLIFNTSWYVSLPILTWILYLGFSQILD